MDMASAPVGVAGDVPTDPPRGPAAGVPATSDEVRPTAPRDAVVEALSRMADGVAHELNTPIQFVGDNLRFLQGAFADLVAALPPDVAAEGDVAFLVEEVPEALAQSIEGLEEMAAVVRAMKGRSSPTRSEAIEADLADLVRSAVADALSSRTTAVDLFLDVLPMAPVRCMPVELAEALVRVVDNAVDAIDARRAAEGPASAGRIVVRTSERAHAGTPGVEVAVADDGCGVDQADKARVFDQFFTTKEVGSGKGQGLSVARAIVVEQHGGRIDLDSAPGEGTTVRVWIPGAEG